MRTYVCKASEGVFSGRASCWCRCEPCWCCSPVCYSDSSDSPDRHLCQKRCCHCTCRPCSACLYSAESQWIDGRTAHEHISLSAQNLWEEIKIWWNLKHETLIFFYFFKQAWSEFHHIVLWIERLQSTLITVHYHQRLCPSAICPKRVSLCLTLICSEDLFSQ